LSTKITVIPGDGIGPEIMTPTLRCLDALNCDFEYEFKQAGLVALSESGELVPQETLESIRQNRLVLKGPLTTPVGEGFSSINVSLCKEFDRIRT
jgi:isocitrate dehydrogenase (NAD+)